MLVDLSGQLSDAAPVTSPESAGALGDRAGSEESDGAGFADLLADAEERADGEAGWGPPAKVTAKSDELPADAQELLPDAEDLLLQANLALPHFPEAALPSMEMLARSAHDESIGPFASPGAAGVAMPELVAMRELPVVAGAQGALAGQPGGGVLSVHPLPAMTMTAAQLSSGATRPVVPRAELASQARDVPASAALPFSMDAGPSFGVEASVLPTEVSAPGPSAGAEALGDQLASAQVTGRGVRNARVVVATQQGVVRGQVSIDQANESVTVKLAAGGLAGQAKGRVSELRRSLASHGLALEEFALGVDDLARSQQVTESESAHKTASQRFDAWLSSELAEPALARRDDDEAAAAAADAEADDHEASGAGAEQEEAQGDAQGANSDTSADAHTASDPPTEADTASEPPTEGPARIERPYERAPRVGHLLDTRL